LDSGEHTRQCFVTPGAVLRVDQKPVITAMRQLFCNRWTMGVHEQSELRTSFTKLSFKLLSSQTFSHLSFLLSYLLIECCETVRAQSYKNLAHDTENDPIKSARHSTLFSEHRKQERSVLIAANHRN